MKRIIRFVIFILLLVILITCSSSSLTIVDLNLPLKQDIVLEVRPLSEADQLLASRGIEWRGVITDLLSIEVE